MERVPASYYSCQTMTQSLRKKPKFYKCKFDFFLLFVNLLSFKLKKGNTAVCCRGSSYHVICA